MIQIFANDEDFHEEHEGLYGRTDRPDLALASRALILHYHADHRESNATTQLAEWSDD